MNSRIILVFFFTLALSIVAVIIVANINPASAQNSRAPSAPTGLAARAVFEDGNHRIEITWDDHPRERRRNRLADHALGSRDWRKPGLHPARKTRSHLYLVR